MVLCMSSILIHMSYFSFYIISSFRLHCSETRVVGLINIVIIDTYFVWGQHSVFDIAIVTCECAISKLQILWSRVCYWYYTHVLLFFLYYFVVPFSLFLTMGRFKVLVDCQCIGHSVNIYSSFKKYISKGKWNILEILILLFGFLYFDVEFL